MKFYGCNHVNINNILRFLSITFLLFLSYTSHAALSVSPSSPSPNDLVTISISDIGNTSCVPTHFAIPHPTIQENNVIRVDLQPGGSSDDFCNQVLTPWSVDGDIGTFPEGQYTVEVYKLVDGKAVLFDTVPFLVETGVPTTKKRLKTDYSRTETDELGTKYLTQYARITFHDDVDESSARAVIIRLVDELPATVAAYYPGLSYILDVGTDSLETLRAKLEFIRNFDPSIKYVSNIPLDKVDALLPDTMAEGHNDVSNQQGYGYVGQIKLEEAYQRIRQYFSGELSETVVSVFDSSFDVANPLLVDRWFHEDPIIPPFDYGDDDSNVNIDEENWFPKTDDQKLIAKLIANGYHGTVVSSIISSSLPYQTGTNPLAKILPIKIGTKGTSDLASGKGFDGFLTRLNSADPDKSSQVRIINYSGGGSYNPTKKDHITFAKQYYEIIQGFGNKHNILVVTTAGNDKVMVDRRKEVPRKKIVELPGGLSSFPGPPLNNLITVSAYNEGCDCSDTETECKITQNYGPDVDLVAPEFNRAIYPPSDPWIFRPGEEPVFINDDVSPPDPDRRGGTSFAAPIVSGVASLLLSIDPSLSASEIKKILLDTAVVREMDNPRLLTGKSEYRCVNADAAVEKIIDRLNSPFSDTWSFNGSGTFEWCAVHTIEQEVELTLTQNGDLLKGTQATFKDQIECCKRTDIVLENVTGRVIGENKNVAVLEFTIASDAKGCQCAFPSGCTVSIPDLKAGESFTASFDLTDDGRLVPQERLCLTNDPNGECVLYLEELYPKVIAEE